MSNALESITVKGFKSIASLENLELRPINVLIGANGSGKSNFLEVFRFLHEIREGRLENYVAKAGGAEQLLHFGYEITKEISIQLSFADNSSRYMLKLEPTEEEELFVSMEGFERDADADLPVAISLPPRNGRREAQISAEPAESFLTPLKENLADCRVYHFHDTSPMRKSPRIDENRFLGRMARISRRFCTF